MANLAFFRRNALNAALASVAALGIGASASALAATATSNSDATIVAAITIATNNAGLGFGSVVANGTTAGTVVMGANGARTCTTVSCVAQDAGQASGFNVTGEAGYTYAITLPASTTLKDTATTPNTMTVDTFTDSKGGSGTLTSGADSFTVGATLYVGAAQVANTYTGTFDVTVEYN